ncbi:MAG: zinc-ribbon domain-containing protein [Lachnospiraceae bacterium]|nr:zinc-ribbon domain-containing protein [Lachnospiraceae bacterium]
MYCRNCGNELAEDARFCKKCGVAVSGSEGCSGRKACSGSKTCFGSESCFDRQSRQG